MNSTTNNNYKPTYEELEALCRRLQDQVSASIAVQQELIQMKNDLNKELNRFKLVDSYSKEALFYDNVPDFAMLTVEYFIQAFEQPHCLFAEFDKDEERLCIQGIFGFRKVKVAKCLSFKESLLKTRNTFFLNDNAKLSAAFKDFNLSTAVVCPFYDYHGNFTGLIISGQMDTDRFYNPIEKNIRHAFTAMAYRAGTLLTNLKNLKETISNEI